MSGLLDSGVVRRGDSALTMGHFGQAFLSQPGGPFGLNELADGGPHHPTGARSYRHVLRSPRYSKNLRPVLVEAIPLAEVLLLRLYNEPADTRRNRRDAMALEANSAIARVLLDALRVELDRNGVATTRRLSAAAKRLVKTYAHACARAGWNPVPLPPLAVFDRSLSEDPGFRMGIAGSAAESIMAVSQAYLYDVLARGTWEQRGHADVFEQDLVWPADGSPPYPQLLRPGVGPGGEFGCGLEIDGVRQRFVVRPWLADQHGSAPHHLLAQRALDLVKRVAGLPQHSLAEELRIPDFIIRNDEHWARGVRIAAAYKAHLEGVL